MPFATKSGSCESASDGLSDDPNFVANGIDPSKLWSCLDFGNVQKIVAPTLIKLPNESEIMAMLPNSFELRTLCDKIKIKK